MKINQYILRLILVLVLTLILSLFTTQEIKGEMINTLFTIASIMFSVGLGIIVSVNLQSIKNYKAYKIILKEINHIRNSFIINFCIACIPFVLQSCFDDRELTSSHIFFQWFYFKLGILFIVIELYAICYFINNFIAIQKFNSDLYERIITELNQNKAKHSNGV